MIQQAYTIAGLMFLLGISLLVINFCASVSKKVFRRSEPDKPDESYPNTESGQRYYEANNQWRLALERVGVTVSLVELAKISESHWTNDKDYVPFEVLFEREDVHYLLSCFYPTSKWGERNDGYKEWGVKIDSLESALYVKGLLDYIKTIHEAKGMIGNPDNRHKWSSEVNEKWNMLDKEEFEAKSTIKSIIYEKPLNAPSFLLCFSNDAILTDEERLQMVDEKIKGAKPVVIKPSIVSEEAPVTSLALVDINNFLNEHDLPEEVEEELKETMSIIKEKLQKQSEEHKEEKIRMDAQALNKAAKHYHQVP